MINIELKKLYQDNWEEFSEKLNNILEDDKYSKKPTNPLLIRLKDEMKYLKADIRVVFYGQETFDWCGNFKNDIERSLKMYDDFFNTKKCFKRNSPFWHGIKLLLNEIQKKYPEKTIDYIWNNTVKVGKSGEKNMPPKYIYKIEEEYFNILSQEIEILQPNLLLFLSGPRYDGILKEQIDNFKDRKAIKDFNKRQLAKFNFNDEITAYRTYHPSYLRRKKGTKRYFEAIIEDINI